MIHFGYMDLFVLLLIGIFAFAIATLFRSNEAINRVQDVEKELGVLEDEVKEATDTKVHIQEATFTPHIELHPVETPFPEEKIVHKE